MKGSTRFSISVVLSVLTVTILITILMGCNQSKESVSFTGVESQPVNIDVQELKDALANQEELMILGGTNGTLKAYSSDLEKVIALPEVNPNESRVVEISPDNQYLVSCDQKGTVFIWDIDHQTFTSIEGAHRGDILSAAFSPDGKTFATAGKDRTIKIWETRTLSNVQTLKGHGSYVLDVAYSPDGQSLASVGSDNLLVLWDVKTGKKTVKKKNSHYRAVNQVCFSPDGTALYTASSDSLIKVWTLPELECVNTLKGHDSEVLALAVSPDGKTIFSAGRDKKLLCFDAATGEKIASITLIKNLYVAGILFSDDGQRVYVGDISGEILCLDCQSKQILYSQTVDSIKSMTFL